MDQNVFWFRDDAAYMLFTASLDIRKNHFSGLMVFNPMPEDGYRMIFLTEFGLKVFDMEFAQETGFMVHYIMPAMDRKTLVKLLQNDLGLLPAYPVQIQSTRPMRDRRTDVPVFQAKAGREKYDCFIREDTGKLERIIQSSRLFRKVQVDYFSTGGNRLDSVSIKHLHMKLNIKLTQIDEIPTAAE